MHLPFGLGRARVVSAPGQRKAAGRLERPAFFRGAPLRTDSLNFSASKRQVTGGADSPGFAGMAESQYIHRFPTALYTPFRQIPIS
jgi:hypothetical protein